jgi:hypothetical protein
MMKRNARPLSRPFSGLPAQRHALLPQPFRHPMR